MCVHVCLSVHHSDVYTLICKLSLGCSFFLLQGFKLSKRWDYGGGYGGEYGTMVEGMVESTGLWWKNLGL